MIRILILCFSVLLFQQFVYAESKIIRTLENVPVQNNYNNYNYQNDIYSRDLCQVENYLYGRNFYNESLQSRLNRIEKYLFNRSYQTMNMAQRMNNILSNYRNDYSNRNYLADYYETRTPVQRIFNRFLGQPTGYTPSILNAPYTSDFIPSFSQGFSSNRGYGYRNSVPATTRAGIQILN